MLLIESTSKAIDLLNSDAIMHGMNLNQWLAKTNTKKADFARAINVSDALLYQWLNEIRPIAAQHCPSIERATNGAVRCEVLRPDVDWAYLRTSKPLEITKQ